jgi:hypothetical protein
MIAEKNAVSIFGKIFEGIAFQTLKVPFAAVAVDLIEGVPVIFAAGREVFLVGFDVSAPVELSEDDLSTVELVLRLLDLSTRSKQSADRELSDVLFQPVDRSYPWSSFAEHKEFFGLGRRYMTEERLAAFGSTYLEKCVANVREDKNVSRKYFSGAKLKRFMAQR